MEYVKKNINVLNKHCRSFIKHVYVIDNASNLPKTLSNDFISIIYNKNLGGSGGYARGMYEVHKDKKCTHILLMDADVRFTPETLNAAINKINNINRDDWIGFGMSSLEKPDRLFEVGAFWNGIKVKINNKNLLFNSSKALKQKKYNYSGWWSIIMPASVIDSHGYPYPFFIKFDDVEYALRRKNENIIFDKNIYVHHESFKIKSRPHLKYYNIRNGLITNDLHHKHPAIFSTLQFVLKIIKYYLSFHFYDAEATFLGVKDYLKGPQFLIKNSSNIINDIVKKRLSKKLNYFFYFFSIPFIALYYSVKLFIKEPKLKKKYKESYSYLISEKYWLAQF